MVATRRVAQADRAAVLMYSLEEHRAEQREVALRVKVMQVARVPLDIHRPVAEVVVQARLQAQ